MAGAAPSKPLSPHIWQWRWHITMLISILHRATGVVLYLGVIGLVVWLSALAAGPAAYDALMGLVPPWVIAAKLCVLAGIATFHLANGVRHFFWDAGKGFAPKIADRTALLVLVLAVLAFAAAAWMAVRYLNGAG